MYFVLEFNHQKIMSTMNKKVSITLLLLLIPVVLLTHVSWSQKENGLMFNVDGRDVDFVGIIKNEWRMATNTFNTHQSYLRLDIWNVGCCRG